MEQHKSPEIDSHTIVNWYFIKEQKQFDEEVRGFSTNIVWTISCIYEKRACTSHKN